MKPPLLAAAVLLSLAVRVSAQEAPYPEVFETAVQKAAAAFAAGEPLPVVPGPKTPADISKYARQFENYSALASQAVYVQSGRAEEDDAATYNSMIVHVARRFQVSEPEALKRYGGLRRAAAASTRAAGTESALRAGLIAQLLEDKKLKPAARAALAKKMEAAKAALMRQLKDDGSAGTSAEVQATLASRQSRGDATDLASIPPRVKPYPFPPQSVPTTALLTPQGSDPSYFDRLASLYGQAAAVVSAKIEQAGVWLTGVYRTVSNSFYNGIELIAGYGYKLLYPQRDRHYGTKQLVDGIRKISAYMKDSQVAETDILIGDVSAPQGGKAGGHLSHRTGVDADIGYFMVDAKTGRPWQASGFVEFDDSLRGHAGGRAVRFDSKRNWELVKAIIANPDPDFKPVYIFMSLPLEKAVLAQASGEDADLRARAAVLMHQWPGHGNHLHLRVE